MVTASLCFALMSLCTRLVEGVPSIEKAFFRNFFAFLISGGILLRKRIPIKLTAGSWPLMATRAAAGTMGVICNFYAIDHTLFANANMLNKLSPFAAISFSALLYREKVSPFQLCCVAGAFVGSLFILKPGGAEIVSYPALIGLLGGISAGLSQSCLRGLKVRRNHTMVIVFIFSGLSCLVTFPFILSGFALLTLRSTSLLLMTATFAACGQFALTTAYSLSPAREVSIYDYSQMIFAGLLGFFFFDQIPDALSLLGYAVIFAASYLMYRGTRKDSLAEISQ